MDLDADIVPGESLGGLRLQDEILEVIAQLEGPWTLREERTPDGSFTWYTADGVFLVSVEEADMRIKCLVAHAGYRGRLWGYVHTGMTVDALLRASPEGKRKGMHMYLGFLFLDMEESTGFLLPPQHDDLDHLSDLPGELVLDALYVMPAARKRTVRKNGEVRWDSV
jgi:hypothetical protein